MPEHQTLIVKGIDRNLYKEFKALCVRNETTIREAIIDLIKHYVRKGG